MRRFLFSALACLMLVTNVAAGIARGQADPAALMVICTGHAPVMVYIDESGAPTGPPVLCPDGVLALFDAWTVVPHAAAPLRRAERLTQPSEPVIAAQDAGIVGKARAPPSAA